MSAGSGRSARVELQPRSLRSLRWSHALTRRVLYATAAVGVAATIRFAVAPPAFTVAPSRRAAAPAIGDEWFAERFATAYLSWSANLAAREAALAPFIGAGADPLAGVRPALGAVQQAQALGVAAVRDLGGSVAYTVAVQVTAARVLYLEVDVAHTAGGAAVLAHYPAIVAAPRFARAAALDGAGLATVGNASLKAMLVRALRNYLAGSAQNLAADLAPGADVTSPQAPLLLSGIERLAVEPSGAILATLEAADTEGDSYTLSYTVGVLSLSGRWEISSIDPTTSE